MKYKGFEIRPVSIPLAHGLVSEGYGIFKDGEQREFVASEALAKRVINLWNGREGNEGKDDGR